MKTWCIWIRDGHDDYTWLEAAWTDDMTAENHEGWLADVNRAKDVARECKGEMRIQAVSIPGVHELFDIPEVKAEPSGCDGTCSQPYCDAAKGI